ncbi:MAG: hypothetical protein ACQGVC_24840 [Myxococcota bacterium]
MWIVGLSILGIGLVWGALFGALMLAVVAGIVVPVPDGSTQIELASLMLAAASLVVTGVGIAVAIAAFFGWQQLKEAAIKAAHEAGGKAGHEAGSTAGARAGFEALAHAGVSDEEGREIMEAQPGEEDADAQ